MKKVVEELKKADKIAIFNHINPDGDAHGSAFALSAALRSLDKKAKVFLRAGDDSTKEYELIKDKEQSDLKIEDCDLLVAVDCADIERLGEFSEVFVGNTVAIDHHATHKPFAKNTLVVSDSPATGEIVFDVIKSLNAELTYNIAYNLYLAITCDTGSFKYSSTTPKTHMIAAELVGLGIDFSDMTKQLFDSKSFEYLQLYKKGIESLEIYENGKIAMLAFGLEDFVNAGIREADADGVVNLPNSILGAEVGVYIRQRDDAFKVSLRSNGRLNVAVIAEQFGGGGHKSASGFSIKAPLAQVKTEVLKALKIALEEL